MKMNRAVLTAVVILVLAGAGWWMFRRGSAERIDLLSRWETAQKDGAPYSLVDATLAGETKKAILAPPNGRIHFKVKVPEDGWLKVSLGMQPESWDKEGDGVYFFAGVSDGRSFEQLFTQTVNPFKNPSERRWIPVTVDLSAYAGEEMEIILNTRATGPNPPPGTPPGGDSRNDLPLWGAPEIVRR
jgi:hypothetical protein